MVLAVLARVEPACAKTLAALALAKAASAVVLAVLARVEPACAKTLAALALAKAAITLIEFADKEDSSANGIPPDVDPSWTTIVFLSVSTVISATAPVKVAVCAVLPLLHCICVAI